MRKRKIILWACLIVLLTALVIIMWGLFAYRLPHRIWAQLTQTSKQIGVTGTYRVTQVSDGDTIEVDMNGTVERVRLIGVDTPETHRPNTPVQCFGPEAAQFMTDTLHNQYVRLVTDPASTNRDRYDRLLRYVFLNDVEINHEIIKQGYGFAYTPFPFALVDSYIASERAAQQARRGLWGSCISTMTDGVWQTSFP